MTETVLQALEMKIDCEDDIFLVRRAVREMAQACKFDVFATSAVTTAASELARNVWVHAGGGTASLQKVTDDVRFAVRATFQDHGPGIENLERVLVGGYSTAKSMGLGLSGSRRLVDEFHVESTVGKGTTVMFVKWTAY